MKKNMFDWVEYKYGFTAAFFCFAVVIITIVVAFGYALIYAPWALLALPATAGYMLWSVRNE